MTCRNSLARVAKRVSAAALAAVLPMGVALSQNLAQTIGQDLNTMTAISHQNCLAGVPRPRNEIDQARIAIGAAMQAYLGVAGAAAPADITTAFAAKAERNSWMKDGAAQPLTSVDDPLARGLAASGRAAEILKPTSFVLAGNEKLARGTWHAAWTSSDGTNFEGSYLADFQRERGGDQPIWKIKRIELTTGATGPGPATQFCREPGDIEPFNKAVQAAKVAHSAAKQAAQAPPE